MNLKQLLDRKPALNQARLLKDGSDVFALSSVADIESKDIDETKMTIRHVISSTTRDRAGDELASRGCDYENFKKNPIVQYEHGALLLPIGKAEDDQGRCTIEIHPERIISTTWFSRTFADAAAVFALYAEKILRGWSVGFTPIVEPERLEKSDDHFETGFLFSGWQLLEYSAVKVPCNQDAVGLRSLLTRGKIAGEKFSRELVKSLEPLAAAQKAWSPGYGAGFVELRVKRMEEMSKKWKKAAKPKGIEVTLTKDLAVTGTTTLPIAKQDGISGSSGTQGGYATPTASGHENFHSQISNVAAKNAMDGDSYHCKCSKSDVHHQYKSGASQEHIGNVMRDLSMIDGMKSITQSSDGPGEGYMQVHPKSTMQTIGDGDADIERALPEAIQKKIADLPAEKASELQECVSRKIPKLIDEGYPHDQAIAIAFSYCGEKLFSAPVTKDDDDTAEKPEDAEPGVSLGGGDLPHSAAVFQHIIEVLESECTVAEPEARECMEELLAETRRVAKERHPDIPFGGDGDEEQDQEPKPAEKKDPQAEQEQQRKEEEEARDALDHYRGIDFAAIAQRAVDGSDKLVGVDIGACVERALKTPLERIKASDDRIAEQIYAATGKRL